MGCKSTAVFSLALISLLPFLMPPGAALSQEQEDNSTIPALSPIHSQKPMPVTKPEPNISTGTGATQNPLARSRSSRLASKIQVPTIAMGIAPGAVTRIPAPVQAGQAANPAKPALKTIAETGFVELEQREEEPKFTLNVKVNVSQQLNAVDTFMIYPYPVKPPKIKTPITPLPTDKGELKNMLINSGYRARADLRRPYPDYGWRFQIAFRRAVAKSGEGMPRTIFTIYPWMDKMIPYITPEILSMNAVEQNRTERYEKALEDYSKSHLEIETSSISKGLYPVALKISSKGIGQTKLPAGNWWLTGTHKTAGLSYYWLVPFSASAADTININLTDLNSLVIEGGW